MTLRLNGATSGFTEIDAPAVAGSNTLVLPTGAGSANQFLKNGSTAGSLGWSSLVEDSAGRCGIGTSSPGDALTVQGTGNSYIGLQSATSGYASLKQIVTATAAWLRTETSHSLYLGTNQTSAIAIDTSQRVGIGTTTVQAPLHIGTASAWMDIGASAGNRAKVGYDSNNLIFGSSSSAGQFIFKNNVGSTDHPNSSGSERMRIASDGSLFLYTLSGSVSAMAGLKYNTSTKEVYYDTSSRLAKENIADLKHGLDAVKAIQPRTYTAIGGDPNQEIIGFIADELVSVVPEAVFSGAKSAITGNDEDTEIVPLGISYDSLIPVLVKALQEATAKIETLEARLTALEVTP